MGSLNMTIGMFGPDEGLTTVELTLIPSCAKTRP